METIIVDCRKVTTLDNFKCEKLGRANDGVSANALAAYRPPPGVDVLRDDESHRTVWASPSLAEAGIAAQTLVTVQLTGVLFSMISGAAIQTDTRLNSYQLT
jgi:hypothetical protein